MPYRVRNWSDYNAGLKQRGSLTLWLSKDALEQWVMNTATGRRGACQLYSDTAIATVATLKSVFHLAGRQAQGFVESVFQLMNIPLPVPDHSTVSRRLAALSVSIPVQPQSRARHVVVDSVGVKVYGEGNGKLGNMGWANGAPGVSCTSVSMRPLARLWSLKSPPMTFTTARYAQFARGHCW